MMIKKIRIFLVILFLLSGVGHAQFIQSYGIKAGFTFAKHEFEGFFYPEEEIQRRLGFTGGFFVEWLDISVISIITQFEYSQRGLKDDITQTDEQGNPAGTLNFSTRLDYLSVPILAKITFPSKKISPYLLAGIRYDRLLRHSGFLEETYAKFRKNNIGGALGVGIQLHTLKAISPLIELRYNLDFMDSYKPAGFSARNNAIDVTLGILL